MIPRTAKSNKTCEVDSAYKLVERTINEISFGNYWKALLEQWTFSKNSKDKQLDRDARGTGEKVQLWCLCGLEKDQTAVLVSGSKSREDLKWTDASLGTVSEV